MKKELLFSVTKKDFDFKFTKGTGKGGQKKNKTSSACHCIHRDSGAHGYAEDSREQGKNRKLAFERCINTIPFKNWLKIKIAEKSGELSEIEDEIEKKVYEDMKKIKIEYYENNTWHTE